MSNTENDAHIGLLSVLYTAVKFVFRVPTPLSRLDAAVFALRNRQLSVLAEHWLPPSASE